MPKLKLTANEIKPYLEKIENLNMIVPVWWNELSPEDIAEAFNGVGSDLTWKWLRKILSFIFRWALCAVIIHDTVWQYKDKYNLTEADFYVSNEALKVNARIELPEHTSKWWNPFLYWYRYKNAWYAQRGCNNFGKDAWNTKNEEEKKENDG